MSGRIGVMLIAVILSVLNSSSARAQDFRVNTRLYDERPARGEAEHASREKSTVIGRSFSIFHAGKVYDYIDTIGEITVFEPAHDRFTIVSHSRMMATTLPFAEIENIVFRAEQQAEHFIKQAEQDADPRRRALIGPIRMHLTPDFKETADAKRKQFRLASKYLTYDVQYAPCNSPKIVEAYARYADWTARLNYVLHSQALLPKPRIALNAALRKKQVLPVEVALDAEMGGGLHLRATHQFQWKLDTTDRSWLRHWETLLSSKEMQHVSFEAFQRALASDQMNARR
jgi:hypothetical protein